MESGPNRVNVPLGGPVIPRSRRNLFKDQSFGDSYNAGIKAGKAHASGTQHAKEKVGRGGRERKGACLPVRCGGYGKRES